MNVCIYTYIMCVYVCMYVFEIHLYNNITAAVVFDPQIVWNLCIYTYIMCVYVCMYALVIHLDNNITAAVVVIFVRQILHLKFL